MELSNTASPMTNRRVFYVLRHSERLDEADEAAWTDLIRRTYPSPATSSTTTTTVNAKKSSVTTLPPITTKSKTATTSKDSSGVRRGSGTIATASLVTTPRSSRGNNAPPTASSSSRAAKESTSTTTAKGGKRLQRILSFIQSFVSPNLHVTHSGIALSSATAAPPSSSTMTIPKRLKQYFIQDPILSPKNGIQYAEEVAQTMQQLIASTTQTTGTTAPFASGIQVRLYSSKLRRAIQTAIPIARSLNIPLYLSTGLSMAIAAIRKTGNGDGEGFQFISIQELKQEYPDINFVDIDNVITSKDSWINAIAMILQQSCDPLSGIMNESIVNVIVGHRETIRGLAGEYLNTPYCAIAVFESPEHMDPTMKLAKQSNGKRRDGESIYPLITVLDRHGQLVDQTKKGKNK